MANARVSQTVLIRDIVSLLEGLATSIQSGEQLDMAQVAQLKKVQETLKNVLDVRARRSGGSRRGGGSSSRGGGGRGEGGPSGHGRGRTHSGSDRGGTSSTGGGSSRNRDSPSPPRPKRRRQLDPTRGEVREVPDTRQRDDETGTRRPTTFVSKLTKIEGDMEKLCFEKLITKTENPLGFYAGFLREFTMHESVSHVVEKISSHSISWESDKVAQILRILRIENIVGHWADLAVGRLILASSDQSGQPVTTVINCLCQQQEEKKEVECRKWATECACVKCSAYLVQADDCCCVRVQAMVCVMNKVHKGFTSTEFHQCIALARKLSVNSPLLNTPISPADLRLLVQRTEVFETRLMDKLLKDRSCTIPTLLSGTFATYYVDDSVPKEIAVLYIDGDGGFLVADHIAPGLLQHSQRLSVPKYEVKFSGNQSITLVPFREAFHDAVELGHEYKYFSRGAGDCRTSRKRSHGFNALCLQRKLVANSVHCSIVVHGTTVGGDDGSKRLLVEIVTTCSEGKMTSNGWLVVQEGYSFAVTRTFGGITPPESYNGAEDDAKEQCKGMWLQGYHQLVGSSDLKPWSIKSLPLNKNKSRECEDDPDVELRRLTITNKAANLNEARLLLYHSDIKGAGLAVFLRPPIGHTAVKVTRGTSLCYYGDQKARDQCVVNSDYYFELSSGRGSVRCYDEHAKSGYIGRYANQGGLIEGLNALCVMASQEDSLRWHDINAAVKSKCNAEFKTVDDRLCIVATKEIVIQPGSQAVEILVDYKLREYWVFKFITEVCKMRSFSELNDFQKSAIWPICSDNSRLDQNERTHLLQGNPPIPPHIAEGFRSLPCPHV